VFTLGVIDPGFVNKWERTERKHRIRRIASEFAHHVQSFFALQAWTIGKPHVRHFSFGLFAGNLRWIKAMAATGREYAR
jgi:hypothetical protein